MTRHAMARLFVSLTLGWAVLERPLVEKIAAAPADNPCDKLPKHGLAKGIEKRCHGSGGGSSGISKGDFNGDGFADLAIGMPGLDSPATTPDAGGVIVIYGSAGGLTTNTAGVPLPQVWTQNTPGVPGAPEAGDQFGAALASGDFNGDGFSDLAIGLPGEDINATLTDVGAVVVIYGSANGLTVTDSSVPAPALFDLAQILPASNHAQIGAQLGTALAWGDFDGNGAGDLAIGAPWFGKSNSSNGGAVWILYGTKEHGLQLIGNHLWEQNDLERTSVGAEFGATLSSGDFEGNGYSDLAIGAPGVSTTGEVTVLFGGPIVGLNPDYGPLGAAFILYGEVDFHNAPGCFVGIGPIIPAAEGDQFGFALASGDFNGDGKSDLAIGVPARDVGNTAEAGIVNVIYGDAFFGLGCVANQTWDQNRIGGHDSDFDQFGLALAAGDFNGDGRADLAIGVPFEDVQVQQSNGSFVTLAGAGEVDVIYGRAGSGLSLASHPADFWREGMQGIQGGPAAGNHFGASLSAWNFGHNEFTFGLGVPIPHPTADLAIGVPNKDVSGVVNAGAVYVIYGSFLNNGLNASNNARFFQNSPGIPSSLQTNGRFGTALY